ncbi:MAG TPA: hypothetical protein PKW18_12465 [Candidatus Sumerlaeota bacterium]|nr:hypothetical protein [Candidatus Sumerlaeota bacterium]HPL75368.1 hypothetical protein [Candidatus Sumerlaeota bacterium]
MSGAFIISDEDVRAPAPMRQEISIELGLGMKGNSHKNLNKFNAKSREKRLTRRCLISNIYLYCRNNPIVIIDPTGLFYIPGYSELCAVRTFLRYEGKMPIVNDDKMSHCIFFRNPSFGPPWPGWIIPR